MVGDDAEVRLATQPSYPFENSLIGVICREDMKHNEEDDAFEHCLQEGQKASDILLLEGRQLCYGSKFAWECYRA